MITRYAFCVFSFFVLYAGDAYAQLHLLTAADRSYFSALRGSSYDIAAINNDAYLLIGPSIDVRNTNIGSRLLDTEFDESYRYFILYPIRKPDAAAIRPYGRVLHAAPGFIVFKTKHKVLNDFAEFHGYRISLVRKGNVTPDFSAAGAKSGEPGGARTPDPEIQKFVDAVSDDSLWARVSALAPMERYAKNTNTKKCAEYIQKALKSYSFDEVILQEIGSGYSPNVVAIKYGTQWKDSVFVVGGHYDVYAQGAPGVDDNGSGTATVMEAARILSKGTYKTSLEFVLFSAEEVGMDGSWAYVDKFLKDKKKAGGMLNIDVTLYRWDDKPQVHATYDNRSKGLFQEYFSCVNTYLPGMSTYDGYDSWHKSSSDNASFWSKGLKALMTCTQLDDDHVNPLMHTKDDDLDAPHYCRPALVAVTKSVVAASATWANLQAVTAAGPHPRLEIAGGVTVQKRRNAVSVAIPRSMRSLAGCAAIFNSKGLRIAALPFAPGSETMEFSGNVPASPGIYFVTLSNGAGAHVSSFIAE